MGSKAHRDAAERLAEALYAERQTSSGNAMTIDSVYRFLNGAWLDYITEAHEHDPDVCDECQEMVMEALRD